MNVSATGLAVAFAAGVVAFASPCVLPLIPGYLSFLGGTQASGTTVDRRGAVTATIAFTAGFAAVFTLAGAGVGLVGAQFVEPPPRPGAGRRDPGDRHGRADDRRRAAAAAARVAAAVRLAPPHRRRRGGGGRRLRRRAGRPASGRRWPASWPSPPPRAARPTAPLLLAAYSLGLALPLIAAGLFFTTFLEVATPIRPYLGTISRVAGALLIVTGVLLASGQLEQISARLGQ